MQSYCTVNSGQGHLVVLHSLSMMMMPSIHSKVLDVMAGAWSLMDTHGDSPSPRAGHSAVVVNQTMWVFGGGVMGPELQDSHAAAVAAAVEVAADPAVPMWSLELATATWTAVPPVGNTSIAHEVGLWGHTATLQPDGKTIYYYGGNGAAVGCVGVH